MGLIIETWSIAFRERSGGNILTNLKKPFKLLRNGFFGWAADPFLYDYKDETYLFVEFFSYKSGKGEIAYAKYDKKKKNFTKYKTILSEDFHMSYPLVFEYKNVVYMMPETSSTDALYLYRAIDFPDKWERLDPLLVGEKLTDTTPVNVNGDVFAVSYKLGIDKREKDQLILLNIKIPKASFSQIGVISDDISLARPGGNFFFDNDRLIRVSQDCEGEYGRALNFLVVLSDFCNTYNECLIKKLESNEIFVNTKRKSAGIHTYNLSEKFEVVDLKYYKFSIVRIIYKILRNLI